MKKGRFLYFFKSMFHRITEHGIFNTSGEMAYFLVLSLFPLIAFTFTIASFTWLSQERILLIFENILKPEIFNSIKGDIYTNIASTNKIPLLSFSMIGTIFSASGGIWAIMRSLNRAYEVRETRPYFELLGMCILITIIISSIMILALFIMVFGEVIENFVTKNYVNLNTFIDFWQFMRYLAIELIIFMMFSFLYYISPNLKLKYREVVPGALLVTVGWSIVSAAFSVYVNNFNNFTKTYGSIGAGILLLVWLYWNSTLILIGGELNAYFHKKHNLPVILRGKKPAKNMRHGR